jgi:uncharacterized protein (TIGR02466 family)
MEINDWFVTPISISNHPEMVPVAYNLFWKHRDKFHKSDNGFITTLKRYNAFWWNESSVNLLEDPEAIGINNLILSRSEEFLKYIGYDTESVNLKISNIWMNKMERDSINVRHSHGGGIVSGCFYVKIPNASSPIYFYNPTTFINRAKLPIANFTKYNTPTVSFNPSEGDLYIWESHIEHEVPSHQDDEERYVMAFDVTAEYKETL